MNVARRLSFVLVAVLLLAAPAGKAQQPAGRGGGGRGAAAGGSVPINAYAYAECGPANAPAVHLVVLTGPIPAAVPASTPQPSVKLVFNTSVDHFAEAQTVTISTDAAKGGPNALALSCPVVGDCVPAQSGTVSIQRRADDGALAGSYQATWPGSPQRTARFAAAWRESGKKCG
jgi:hypothetical protein